MQPSVRAKEGLLHQQALRLLRAMWRHAIVPNVIIYNAAISACEKGLRHQQALPLLRTMRRPAIVPDVITHNVAIGV